MTEQPTPVDALLSWLIAMDDPTSEEGMAARQTVTLTRIIDRARDAQHWLDQARADGAAAAVPISVVDRDRVAGDVIEAWTGDRHTKGQALRELARLAVRGLHARGLLVAQVDDIKDGR